MFDYSNYHVEKLDKRIAELEAERDQLAGKLSGMTDMYKEEFRYRQEAEAQVELARKALEAIKDWDEKYTVAPAKVAVIARKDLAQLGTPNAALDEHDKAVRQEMSKQIADWVEGVCNSARYASAIRREFGLND